MNNIIVTKFMYRNPATFNLEEGIYAKKDGNIVYVLLDDPYAHEGLNTDNFIPMLEAMSVKTSDVEFIQKEEYDELVKLSHTV